jgi:hypothetical protein
VSDKNTRILNAAYEIMTGGMTGVAEMRGAVAETSVAIKQDVFQGFRVFPVAAE